MLKYLSFQLMRGLVYFLPKKWNYWIGCRIADIDYIYKRKLRTAVKANLKHVLETSAGGPVPQSVINKNAKAVFRNFAKYLVDFFGFSSLDKETIHKLIKVEGMENFQEALKQGKGVIALTAHLGNWELAGMFVAIIGYNVNVVALSHEDARINRLFVNQRSASGVKAIPVGSSPNQYLDVLRNKEVIGLVGDRMTSEAGIEARFFNKLTIVPKGPAVLSLRTKAPIVPAFMVRNEDDTFSFIFEKPIDPMAIKKDSGNRINVITEQLIAVIEKYIKKYPSQWFMFYKRWEE